MVLHCSKSDFFKASIGVEKVHQGIVFRECWEECVEESKKAIEGAALNAHKAVGADHVHLKLFMWREHSVIPDGIDYDVRNRIISRTKAMTCLEEAMVIASTQVIPWKLRNCF